MNQINVRRFVRSSVLLFSLAAGSAFAQTPAASPTPEATPQPPASPSPDAAPTASPAPVTSPVSSPVPAQSPVPAATPEPAASPLPPEAPAAPGEPDAAATPAATPPPAPDAVEPVPSPTPYDYTGPMPGAQPGSRRLRGALQVGLHGYFGEGWNEREVLPLGIDDPPQTEDYLATAAAGTVLYDLAPTVAAVGQLGGHTGSRNFDDESRLTYSAWYAMAGLRLQTPAYKYGLYLQGAAGLHVGQRQYDAVLAENDEEDVRPGGIAHLAGGAIVHVAPGLDVFVEIRGSTAPGSFDGGDPIDLGGVSTFGGLSLRL